MFLFLMMQGIKEESDGSQLKDAQRTRRSQIPVKDVKLLPLTASSVPPVRSASQGRQFRDNYTVNRPING